MNDATLDSVGAIPDDTTLRETIRRRVEAAGTSFYWAMRMLPQERRDGMYAIYAFCREVDDIADDWPAEQRPAGLAAWHDEIEAVYAGRPRQMIGRALLTPVERFGLRKGDFHDIVDGMEMDAVEDIRAPGLAKLDAYCGRVAGAVGHLSVHVFGDPGEAAHRVADALGRALQLTNILRDLDEDAQRGRLYLPRELLDRHGIRDDDPAAVLRHPALPAVCRDVADIAIGHFDAAKTAMAECSRRAMRPAAVMGAFYRAMLEALLRDGWRDPTARVSLSKGRKLWLVLRHGLI
ncbi:MAG TPA: presqualene diphosphate synthase HpnD [Stellaceae bacterium]|nr:presqualene diphosphate synthase HpnD [Stellaceae bacterium]